MQEKKPKGLWRAPRLARGLRTAALALFLAALVLDASGRLAGSRLLWIAGAHAIEVGILAWLPGWWIGPRVARVAWYATLIAFWGARFLRGTAGVPPDPPLIMLEAFGAGTALRFWWKAKQEERRRAGVQDQTPVAP